ncbi:MAG: DUF520 family protein, partial [Proteobacteria bacterium]
KSLDFGKEHAASGNMIRKEINIKEGIDKEAAKSVLVPSCSSFSFTRISESSNKR